ncbi:3-oxoacyl-ACP reductase FabG [Asticcacaulis sp. DXS10W]|uniref:3-oxoacyl-ACP reductase FabG n=1 Tax=Asticcacaulis currens TaxID=2984210 RepID=A0ABT5I9F7_9CAUL|nr:3-oxoacyl-ACP reductase FabG [Asticcacaulis currens]MDC7692823.1 3-oxoacyl-ACP reductase FabG [Asticcacaulis currens]
MSQSTGQLVGKIVLITGAGRGIGRACAQLCAEQGAHVLVNTRTQDTADAAALEIRTAIPHARVDGIAFDVGDTAAVKSAFQAIHRNYKRLDVLVNNAGILRDALVGMVSESLFDEVMRTNFGGTFYCAQMAARLMARQSSGSIINLSSIIGRYGNSGQAVYGASKAAVLGLTYSLAKELGPNNIRVNAIAPGFIETDMTASLPEAKRDDIMRGVRMNRIGKASDVAGAVLFLSSDYSAYVTGQVIGVDGGMII